MAMKEIAMVIHGGEYPDNMPQAIRLTDAEGRSCIYLPVAVRGHVVDSKCTSLWKKQMKIPRGKYIGRRGRQSRRR
jgi:hypothetical protein